LNFIVRYETLSYAYSIFERYVRTLIRVSSSLAYRPSVYLSVCPFPSVTRVAQSKTFTGSIMQFSPYSSPIHWVLWDKFHPEILTGSLERGRQTRMVWDNNLFCASVSRKQYEIR